MGKIQLVLFKIVLTETQVYRPGSDVSGNCVIQLNGEMNLNQLEIKIKGKARVSWSETTVTGNTRRTVTHSDTERCLKLNYWPASHNPGIITCGEHHIPFCFRLPNSNIPSSFEGAHGSIRYRVKAEIHKPEMLSSNHRTEVPVTISSPANVTAEQLMSCVALEDEKTVGCCCTEEYVSLKAETTCGQLVGKVAAINCCAENRSNSEITLRATLKQNITFKAGSHRKYDENKIITVVGSIIQPNSTIRECLALIIPPEIPVLQNQSTIICMDYQIAVTLDIPSAFDLHVYLPIFVTNQTYMTDL